MNMSYPKRIVNSTIEDEFLPERPNFRYKKLNIIMGGNASGKTSLGRLFMLFANYLEDGAYRRFVNIIDDTQREAKLEIDFVAKENILYRFKMCIAPRMAGNYQDENVDIHILYTDIGVNDNYEKCAARFEGLCDTTSYDKIDTSGWNFSYPEDTIKDKQYRTIENECRYMQVLENILKTLDQSIKSVVKVEEANNTYVIKFDNKQVIIKDGKILESEILSSGTKAGLDISYIIASLICDKHDLYYCDERFSYVNSDVEKACLSVMIEKLTGRKQLFFTTHNTDVLDMQLPKHSFYFLKKDVDTEDVNIKCVCASDYLKRNTDSLKHAIENDLFSVAPELHRIYELAEL